jgi:thymidylate kinase
MILIFEGHDKSGKTTIAKELSKRLNIPRFKVQRDNFNWDPAANLKYLTEGVTQFICQTDASIILDRWHPSDFMYSKLFLRPVDMDIVKSIDARLAERNALIIYCYKDPEQFIVDEEDAAFVNPSMYGSMTSLYQQFAALYSKCRYIFLNTSDQDLEKQLDTIIKNI